MKHYSIPELSKEELIRKANLDAEEWERIKPSLIKGYPEHFHWRNRAWIIGGTFAFIAHIFGALALYLLTREDFSLGRKGIVGGSFYMLFLGPALIMLWTSYVIGKRDDSVKLKYLVQELEKKRVHTKDGG